MPQVVVKRFGAEWCSPCGTMKKIFAKVMPDYEGRVTYEEIDVDTAAVDKGKYNFLKIPAIFVEVDGEVKASFVGAKNIVQTRQVIDGVLDELA